MKDVFAAIAVTLTVQTLTAMAMIAPSVLAPVAARDLSIAPQAIGVFVSISYLAAMVSGLVSARLVRRFGPLAVCQATLMLAGVGLAIGSAGVVPVLPVAASLIGFGYGLVTPASSHILAHRAPTSMLSLVFSIKQTGVPIGGAIAGAIVPTVVVALGWERTLPVLGASCVIAALALLLARRQLAEPRAASGDWRQSLQRTWSSLGGPIRLVLGRKALRELAFTSLGYAAVQLVFITYFFTYLNLNLGYSLVAAGLVYALAHAAGVVGRVAWGALADRWIAPRAMLGALGITSAACGLLTAAFTADWPPATVAAVAILFGASAVGWNGVYLAEVARCAPSGQVATATGGTQFFTFAGAFSGPPLYAAAVWATDSYASSFVLLALLQFAVGVRLFRSFEWLRRLKSPQ